MPVEPPVSSPTSLAEAYAALASGDGWQPIAGGTDLMVQITGELAPPPARVLDLWHLDELRGIDLADEVLAIGALTTFAELRRSRLCREQLPALVAAAATIGAAQIQNRATIGGNIVNASPAGDSLPVLLAADAELVLGSSTGERTVAVDDFWLAYRRTERRPDELLVRVRVPLRRDRRMTFRKVGTRRAQAISKVVMAIAWREDGGVWRDVRVGLGSLAATPVRARQTESVLEGAAPRREVADHAAAVLAAEITPIDDVRSTAEYRRIVAARVLHRMLREAGAGSAVHRVIAPEIDSQERVLTSDALDFLAGLHRQFEPRRQEILAARRDRAARMAAGEMPDFLAETAHVRQADWSVAPAPDDLNDRRVEITGPAEPKMTINALNSGARVFMADFEDALSPTWANVIEGQAALQDALRRTLTFTSPEGKAYRLNDETATLVVRPRGWHLVERHLEVDGQAVSGSLFDFGLYLFHNGAELLTRGSGPYFYLPKLQCHHEARLWNDVFVFAQDALGLPRGSIRATVLIETIWAAFEMEEILYELREHAAGLNAGRWDYIFSIIKAFASRPAAAPLPDRAQVTMAVPFMRAYTQLLVKTCHRRGAHAIGGMSAFIPNRREPDVTERALRAVTEDKEREASDGFDGTWVAHPDLVPVAREVFDRALGDRPNQKYRQRHDIDPQPADLLDFGVPGGQVTEAGMATNVSVGIRYIASWLAGTGAAAIDNLMEDVATAEISRSQVWQWVRTGRFSRERVLAEIEPWRGQYPEAAALFEQVALADDFVEFLTLTAYLRLD